MARVSIESGSSSGKSSGSGKKSSGGKSGGLDSAQKIKAGIAVGVIVLAAAFIMWNAGLFESRPRFDANATPDASPEETAAFNQAQQQQQQQQQQPQSTGSTRLPPMPLGSN